MDLDILEQRFRQQLYIGSTLSITRADLELPSLPQFLWPSAAVLALEKGAIDRLSVDVLELRGSASFDILGEADVVLTIRPGTQPPVAARMYPRNGVEIRSLLKSLGAPLQALAQLFDAITVKAFDWNIPSPEQLQFGFQLEGEYRTQIAGATLRLALLRGTAILLPAKLQIDLEGECGIGDLLAPLLVQVRDGKATIAASMPTFSVRDLVQMVGLRMPQLPGLSLIDDALGALEIVFQDHDPVLVFRYDTPLGPARCLLVQQDGEWGIAAGLHARNFKFSNLNSALAPLDAFQEIVAFGDPAIGFATRPLPSVSYPVPDLGWEERAFKEGFFVNGELRFDGFGLELLKSVFGIDRLPLMLPVGTDWSQVRLLATMERPIKIAGDLAIVENFTLSLMPDPQQISAAGTVTVTMFGTQLPRFMLGAALVPGAAELFVLAEDIWREPMGIPVTVEKLGFQVTTQPAYGVLGKIILDQDVIEVAAQLIGNVPTLFVGSLQGEMVLGDLLLQLADIRLFPDYFQPSIKDFDVYIVLNPAGASVVGRVYPFGLSLRGTLSFLGLGFTADIHVSKTRLKAAGQLDGAIRLEPFFRFTGSASEAASIAIDTAEDPLVVLDGALMFLGLEQSARAMLGSDGFSSRISNSSGPTRVDLTVIFGNGRLAADGEAFCKVTGKIGPLKVPGTGVDLGSIRIDTGAEMTVHAAATEGGALALTVRGRLSIAGIDITLPPFEVDIGSFDELPAAVLQYIQANAVGLLADLLNDVNSWLKAIAEGLIEGVENVARTITEYFQRTAKQAADGMLNVLNNSMETTAKALQDIGQTAEEIGRIFHELGRAPEEIAGALKAIGILPKVIGDVLKGLGSSGEDVARILLHVGFPAKIIGDVLGDLFPGLPELPGLPHVKAPHLKHIKAPHLKHIKAPHLKHLKAPHLKKPW